MRRSARWEGVWTGDKGVHRAGAMVVQGLQSTRRPVGLWTAHRYIDQGRQAMKEQIQIMRTAAAASITVVPTIRLSSPLISGG